MARVVYEIVEHNGGWAYKAGDVYSETYASHADAAEAAERAAIGHRRAGQDELVEYEDSQGEWHEEVAGGTSRPETRVREGGSGSR